MISFGKNTFEIALIGIFIIAGVTAAVIFGLQRASLRDGGQSIVIWGALPEAEIRGVISAQAGESFHAEYKYVPAGDLDHALTEALASQQQPDLVIFPHQYLLVLEDRINQIPYTQFSERSFVDTFIDGADVFRTPEYIRAIPFAVDPLVLFFNKQRLSSAGYVGTPFYWDELPSYVENLTDIEGTSVREAAVALGRYGNIRHANQILSAMLMQADVPLVVWREGDYESGLNVSAARQASQSVVRFYTEFGDPEKSVYTWNNALPEDFTTFTTGNLGMYFGQGSEIRLVQQTNPNLSFDIAHIPYTRGDTRQTFGTFWGIGVVDRAPNGDAAFAFINKLISAPAGQMIGENTLRVPVRRDVLAAGTSDFFKEKLYQVGITSRAWVMPSPWEVDSIFGSLIESVATNQVRITEALDNADTALTNSFRNQ